MRITMDYETRRDVIVTHAWETWTRNGLGLDVEDRQETIKSVQDAAQNVYTEDMDDSAWLAATLCRLRGKRKYMKWSFSNRDIGGCIISEVSFAKTCVAIILRSSRDAAGQERAREIAREICEAHNQACDACTCGKGDYR